MRRFQIPGRHVAALAALLVAVVAAGGCRTPQAPLLADPSWPVRHGQAVWQASAGAEEVAGELVFAGYPGSDGYVVEFSKPAVTLFRVVRNADAWELGVPGEGAHGGRGEPPSMIWFQLGDLLTGRRLREGWEGLVANDGARWWIRNLVTGERLEGYLAP